MALVILKKAGEPGEVAINPDRVTHVRSTNSLFTDIFFGEQQVSVEGSFKQIVSLLAHPDRAGTAATPAPAIAEARPQVRSWITTPR